jgi:hypothetical protein
MVSSSSDHAPVYGSSPQLVSREDLLRADVGHSTRQTFWIVKERSTPVVDQVSRDMLASHDLLDFSMGHDQSQGISSPRHTCHLKAYRRTMSLSPMKMNTNRCMASEYHCFGSVCRVPRIH